MKPLKVSLSLFVLVSSIAQASGPEIVKLNPPRISSDAVAVATSCDRPRRTEGVNIGLELIDDKLVVNCYGHGGFGFTTLFGSIEEALSLLVQKNLDLSTPIRIIGSGCMGLTMAIELHRKGFTHVSISTKDKYNIPSWRAGGFFDPGVGNESTASDKHRLDLGLATYTVLREIELGNHPYLTKEVVRRLPIYYPADIECEVEVLEKLQLMPESELITLDFGNGVVHEGYKKQFTYFIDITKLMTQLWELVDQLNIPVVSEEVKQFADCSEPVICNCTGLGSQFLNGDTTLIPTRGHFFMLNAQSENLSLDYMLFTKVIQNGRKEMVYFFPKPAFRDAAGNLTETAGMLGGTFIPCAQLNAQEKDALDKVELEKLAERAQTFFYGA